MAENTEKKFKPSIFMLSLSLHLLLMVVFAMVQFSRGKLFQSFADSPQGAIRTLEAIEQAGIVVPKPSIKERGYSSAGGIYNGEGGVGQSGDGGSAGNEAGNGGRDSVNSLIGSSVASAGSVLGEIEDKSPQAKSKTISFFGNVASGRKVCFVVDCSGSMLGFFGQVTENLLQSIDGLRQDNFYGIVVFRGEQVFEVEADKLLRASDTGKERAVEFINSIGTPSGRPDAFSALKKAIRYKDSIGDSPGVIYFLTDGFDYDGFARQVEEYRERYAPVVKIHTIGFMVNKRDADMLEQIALESGGRFTLYSGGVN